MSGRGNPRAPPPRGGRGRARPPRAAAMIPRTPPPPGPPSAPRPAVYTSSKMGSVSTPSAPSNISPIPQRPPAEPVQDISRRMADVTMATEASSSANVTTGPTLGPQFYRGNHGKPVKLSANYLKLVVEEDKGVFEYEVRFSPLVDNRDQRFRLVNQQRESIGSVKVSFPLFCYKFFFMIFPYVKTMHNFDCRIFVRGVRRNNLWGCQAARMSVVRLWGCEAFTLRGLNLWLKPD